MEKQYEKTERMSTGIVVSAAACFMLFLYAPLELFFMNQDEFFFDLYILLPPIVLNFTIFLALSIGLFLCARRIKKYNALLCIYFTALIATYVQGNFMADWLPIINGELVQWNEHSQERIKSILVWVIVAVLVYLISRKKGKAFTEKAICIVSAYIGLMLVVTTIVLCFSSKGYQKKEIFSTATEKNILTVSENENFIILLLDAVDNETFYGCLAQNVEMQDTFEGFTYYTNAMGGYPYTVHSIPLILAGEWYEKQCDFETFSSQAYAASPLFQKLETAGYRMGIYETDFNLQNGQEHRFDNMLDCERGISSWFTFCRWQIQMAGYRYAPFDLKRFCYVYTDAFNSLKVLPEGERLFEDSNLSFYEKLCNEEMEIVDQKCFRFIHIEGAHAPYKYDAEMNVVEEGNYEDSVWASMKIAETYLQELKESGAYDNTCVILMADHGHVSGFNDNPILLMKGFDEQHELEFNDAPISYGDLQEAYARLLEGKKSGELFDYSEGDYRERRFLFQDDDDNPLEIMEEYIQKGHAGEGDTLIKVREF